LNSKSAIFLKKKTFSGAVKKLTSTQKWEMAKALTLYVCMMIFLSAPVKRNVCKSHFYATQTSLARFTLGVGGKSQKSFSAVKMM
jgi:hypothetical protein